MLSFNIYNASNPQFFSELCKIVQKHPQTYVNVLYHKHKNITEWIIKQLPMLTDSCYTLSTKCYWILKGMITFPFCKTCHKNNNFKYKNVKLSIGYHQHCCNRCTQLDPVVNEHKKQGCLLTLGVEHPLQATRCKIKFKTSCQSKFGVDHNFKAKSCIEKRKNTWIKNYGYDHPHKSSKVKDKTKQTLKNHYGIENPSQSPEIQAKKELTSLKNYGVKFPMQNDDVLYRAMNTCNDRYGVYFYAQSNEFRLKSKRKYFYDDQYFSSAPEIALYIYLVDNKIEFEYQPKISIQYEFDGNIHFYQPDFKIINRFYEIKGDHFFKKDGTMQNPWDHSLDGLYEAKHQCMIINNVIILRSKDYQKYIKYIKQTYGNSYLKQFKH